MTENMNEVLPDNSNRKLDDLVILIQKTNKFLADEIDPDVKEEYLNQIRAYISELFETKFIYLWDRQQISDAEFIDKLEEQVYLIAKSLPYLIRRLVPDDNPYEYIQVILEICKPVGYLYFHCNEAGVRPNYKRVKAAHLKNLKNIIDINLQYFFKTLPLYYMDIKKFLTNIDSDGDNWRSGFSTDLPPQSGPTGGKGINPFNGDWVPVKEPFRVERIKIPSRVLEA